MQSQQQASMTARSFKEGHSRLQG